MKTRTLLALLPFAMAVHTSSALAVPTTSLQVGNSTLFVSGPVLGNLDAQPATGSDVVSDQAPTVPMIIAGYFENVVFESGQLLIAGPDVAPPAITNDVIAPLAVPEPSILLLAGLGLLGLGVSARRR